MPPKRIDYTNLSVQFELLYRDTLEFNLPSEKRDFFQNKLKDIGFSTLNSYNFDKVNTNLTECECKSLKELIQRKEKTVVIANRENYLKVMKSLLSDNPKFIPLNMDKNKCLNYIVNLENKLKEDFKTFENNKKISEDQFKSIFPIGIHCGILYRLPKVYKIMNDNISKFQHILSAIGTPIYKLAKLWYLFYHCLLQSQRFIFLC